MTDTFPVINHISEYEISVTEQESDLISREFLRQESDFVLKRHTPYAAICGIKAYIALCLKTHEIIHGINNLSSSPFRYYESISSLYSCTSGNAILLIPCIDLDPMFLKLVTKPKDEVFRYLRGLNNKE